MFSCEFYEIFKNNFLHRTPLVAASDVGKIFKKLFSNSVVLNNKDVSSKHNLLTTDLMLWGNHQVKPNPGNKDKC